MAVTFDAAVGWFSGSTSPASPGTVSLTVGAGSNRVLVVFIDMAATGSVTGITYNSVALTQSGTETDLNSRPCSVWYLLNPSSGANNIVVSYSGSPLNFFIGGHAFAGAGGVSGKATASGTSTAPSVAVTSATDDMVCDMVVALGNDALTVGAGQTARWNTVSSAAAFTGTAGSTEAGASSVTMSWTVALEPWDIQGINVTVAASGPTGVKTWDGVTQSTGIKTYLGLALASTKSVDGVT